MKELIKKWMVKNDIQQMQPFLSNIPYFCTEEDGKYKRWYFSWLGWEIKYF